VKKIGLRIDVDTLRGTREGVPRLLALLERHQVRATFFFSVGPDNMGRHLWRLLKPRFLWKMLRSNAAALYGWDILLAGTAWPGTRIGEACANIIRQVSETKHEIGLHAWDHYSWQTHVGNWSEDRITQEIQHGLDALTKITGRKIACTAAPGWRADTRIIACKERFRFRYNSDCRGTAPFRPLIEEQPGTVQIPVTLPTYDEVVGSIVDTVGFNDYLLTALKQDCGTPVYTIHAEVEGMSQATAFENLLKQAAEENLHFCPLGELLPENIDALPLGRIERMPFLGREGWLGCQQSASSATPEKMGAVS
jgi:undecaprenyl phosphate-alpha-L-ara4FN deformylase